MFTNITVITRPDDTEPFWYDTPEADIPGLFVDLRDEMIAADKLISVTREDSVDGLTLTRTVVCPSLLDFEEIKDAVELEYPGNYQLRIIYCLLNNHTVLVTNIES